MPPPDVVMDPFDSPFIVDDVHPLITQHFSGNDVKNASLVSNQWYKKFAETPKLMNKLALTLNNKKRFKPSLHRCCGRDASKPAALLEACLQLSKKHLRSGPDKSLDGILRESASS